MWALYLKEIRSFLSSIIGYIFMAFFLVANGLFLWVFTGENNVFEGGLAELKTFFLISPLILCVLVPAITMRSFSEEKRTGTIELLFTKPVSDFSIIFSKYLAGATLVAFALVPTLIYYICIHTLGTVTVDGSSVADDGATITSYIGLLLVGGGFVSIGIFASTITSSQIVSFIISMFFCWFLFYGLDILAVYSDFGNFDALLRNIGFIEHYHAIQRGVIDFRDIIYFLSAIIFFLLLALLRLGARKRTGLNLKVFRIDDGPTQSRLLLVGIVLINYIAAYFVFRLDLTEDKRHSLSENTIDMLQDEERMKERIYFKIYLEGDLPADFMKMRNAVQEKLDEFIRYAGDKIQYEFIDPNGDSDEDNNLAVQQMIYGQGIQFCDLKMRNSSAIEVKTIWPGATVDYNGVTVDRVQFFNRRKIENGEETRSLTDKTISNLEYLFISAIRRATTEKKKSIAFLHGHGEFTEWQTMDVRTHLKPYYKISDVYIDGKITALDGIDALVIAQPKTRFTEKDKFVIDQFIMQGGQTMWFIDPLDVNRDSLRMTGQTLAMSRDLNIEEDMLYRYGVRVNRDVILDEKCAPLYIPGHPMGIVSWYFFPLLDPVNHPITKNIDPVKTEYTASLDIVNQTDLGVKKTVILESSYNSRVFRGPARINYLVVNQPPQFNDGKQGNMTVAVLLEGQFKSPFENQISQEFLNSPDYKTKFLSDSTKMLVVGDADIIRNEVDSAMVEGTMRYRAVPIDYDIYEVPNENMTAPMYTYGNRDFFVNSVDYMLGDLSLIELRTKTIVMRMLDSEAVAKGRNFWKFLNIAGPLIIIFIFALMNTLIRRAKYAR